MSDPFADLDLAQAVTEVSSAEPLVAPRDEPAPELSDLDFSQAEPLPREHVFDENSGIVYDAPAGVDGTEFSYLVATEQELKNPGDFYGMEHLGDVTWSAAKGVMANVLEMPSNILEVFKTNAEDLNVPFDKKNRKMTIFDANIFGVVKAARQLAGGVDPNAANPMLDVISKTKDSYDGFLKNLDLKPGQAPGSQFAFEFAGAGASVLSSIGLTMLTRRPELIAPLFGMIDAGQTMEEGRAAGKDTGSRIAAGSIVGMFTTVTEGLGGLVTLQNLSLNQGFHKAVVEAINNGLQEAAQQAVQGATSVGFGFMENPGMKAALISVGKAAVFGAFWGGTAAGISNQFQKSDVKQSLTKAGLTDEQANKVLDKVTVAVLEDPKVHEEIANIARWELSPHNLPESERASRMREIEKEWKIRVEAEQSPETKGPERSAAQENVARGKALTPAEAEAFPDLLRIQLAVDNLNEQLVKTTDPKRIKQLKERKQAFLRGVTFEEPAASSTAESAPPVASASGADRSIVAEKVARGLALTDEEASAMPDLAAIEVELNNIDDQLENASPEQALELEAERAGVLAKLTFKAEKSVEGDTSFEFGANVAPTKTQKAAASDEQILINVLNNLSSETSGFNAFEDQATGKGGETQGVRTNSFSDVSNNPDFEWASHLGWETRAKREADLVLLKKAVAGEKLPAASQKRLQLLKEALASTTSGAKAGPERRLKQSTVDKQKAALTERVTKAATQAERNRVKQAHKLSQMNERAKQAFEQKHPDAAILEKEALARSLQRQAETAKQATKAEQQRAKGEAKGKVLNEKAKTAFKGPAEQRIKESKALKRMHERMATVAREAARWKKDEILLKNRLIKAIKRGDIAGILAEDRHKIQALQALLPSAKTVSALTELNNRIQEIKAASKEKFNAIDAIRKAKHEQREKYLLNSLGFESPEEVVKAPQTADSTQRDIASEAKLMALTPKRWLRDLGDMFVKIFYDEHNRTFSNRVVREARYVAELEEIKRKNNVTAEELAATVEYDGITFQIQEAILIAAVQSNPEHSAAIIEANKIPVETVEKVIAGLSPKMLNVAADLAAWYDNNFPALAEAVLRQSSGARDLTKVKGVYMPMFRYLDSPTAFDEDVEALMLQDFTDRNFFSRGPGTPGTVKERVAKGGGPGRIDLRAFDLAYRYARVASSYIEMQENLQDMARLMGNGSILRQAIENKHGKAYVKELDEYLKRVANPGYYKDRGTAGVVARALREHASVVYIAGNLMTLLKQPLAVAFYLGNNGIGPSELMGSIGKFISDPQGTVQFMLEKDPQMVNRSISREADEQKHRMQLVNLPQTWAEKGLDKYLKLQVPLAVRQGVHKITNWSFGGLNWIQMQVDAIGWHAAYDKAKLMGKSEREAIEAGQAAVLETQNATSPKDSARLFYSNDYLDLMQQFTDQLNKMYNILFADVPRNWKSGDRNSAFLAMLGIVMGVVLERILTEGEMPEEPEDWYRIAVTGGGALVPVLGPAATSIYMHYNGTPAGISVPAVAAVDVLRAGEAIADGDYEKAFQKILRPIAVTLKLPYPKSSVRRIKDVLEQLGNLGG